MAKSTANKIGESRSRQRTTDCLLRHYREIGVSAVVAALNVANEAERAETTGGIEEAQLSIPSFLQSDNSTT